ncbi:MAG TPA: hypothetical protein VEC35_16370 [Noviherbaspirillum sp.]|nr:hypothetical protein [Noviherbaspirillum sp.]
MLPVISACEAPAADCASAALLSPIDATGVGLRGLNRMMHRDYLTDAAKCRQDGARHAQLLDLAKVARYYFHQMRGLD